MSLRKVRSNILKILYNMDLNHSPLEKTIKDVSTVIDENESRIVEKYVREIQQSKDEIDDKIKKFLKGWDFSELNIIEKEILRIGAYELINNLNDRAVIINEAVRLAKIYADPKAASLINGVLDKI
ncbi:MAG: transcription antitermination factor NusB [Epsilonproteobacteria bacterium]|nr:transcription antitermination factor NusB [Campylobacterota bacterium]